MKRLVRLVVLLSLCIAGKDALVAQGPPAQGPVVYQNYMPPSGTCSLPNFLTVVNPPDVGSGTYQCTGTPPTWQKIQGTSGGATFPETPSIVKSTSSTASVAATGTDLTTLIGSGVYDPSGAATTAQSNATAAFTGDVTKTFGSFATTVHAVHATSGALDGVTVGATTPSTGAFSSLTAATSVSVGASAPAACGTATGCWAFTEAATAGTPTVNQCYIRADSTTNKFLISCNHSAEAPIVTAVAPQVTLIGGAQSGTYTTPAGAIALRVWAAGCGGGGGGSGTSAGNGGNCGSTNTTFGESIVAGFGAGSAAFYTQGGNGGTAAGGTDLHAGNPGANVGLAVATDNGGAGGGAGCGGGAGAGGLAQGSGAQAAGQSGQSPGGGGGGAAANGVPNAGAGGGGGGCVYTLITSPLATYAYATGGTAPGGVAGTSGFAGGDGAAGQIMVEALFQ